MSFLFVEKLLQLMNIGTTFSYILEQHSTLICLPRLRLEEQPFSSSSPFSLFIKFGTSNNVLVTQQKQEYYRLISFGIIRKVRFLGQRLCKQVASVQRHHVDCRC